MEETKTNEIDITMLAYAALDAIRADYYGGERKPEEERATA